MIEEVIENVKEIDENNDLFGTYTKAKSILDFIELKEFISKYKFNHLGVFTYSREEGTVAYKMKNQVKILLIQRYDALYVNDIEIDRPNTMIYNDEVNLIQDDVYVKPEPMKGSDIFFILYTSELAIPIDE